MNCMFTIVFRWDYQQNLPFQMVIDTVLGSGWHYIFSTYIDDIRIGAIIDIVYLLLFLHIYWLVEKPKLTVRLLKKYLKTYLSMYFYRNFIPMCPPILLINIACSRIRVASQCRISAWRSPQCTGDVPPHSVEPLQQQRLPARIYQQLFTPD